MPESLVQQGQGCCPLVGAPPALIALAETSLGWVRETEKDTSLAMKDSLSPQAPSKLQSIGKAETQTLYTWAPRGQDVPEYVACSNDNTLPQGSHDSTTSASIRLSFQGRQKFMSGVCPFFPLALMLAFIPIAVVGHQVALLPWPASSSRAMPASTST